MELELRGKAALVCAASKGLGKAGALALASEGARVAICARTPAALETTAREIHTSTGSQVEAIPADVSRAADIDPLVNEAVRRLGGLDILVTNTGGPRSGPFETMSDADWQGAFESLFMSAVRLTRAALPHMRARGGGRIIHVTSISVKQPIAGLVLSNALRAGITGLAKTQALELARDGIFVNCIAPGWTSTDRALDLADQAAKREGMSVDDVRRRIEQQIPWGRMGAPEEFGKVLAFLASASAAYITGATIQVDGGWTRTVS
jgi:3-oxoacyl-[acyl-carrier protein] reductase